MTRPATTAASIGLEPSLVEVVAVGWHDLDSGGLGCVADRGLQVGRTSSHRSASSSRPRKRTELSMNTVAGRM